MLKGRRASDGTTRFVAAYRPALLNQIYLRSGRLIEPGRAGEVHVSEGFASAIDWVRVRPSVP